MSILVDTPFKVFFDANGAPLDGGYVYIGVAGLNPIANPLTVYWDAALTIPATNIRTSRGFLVYNGSPGNIYSSVNYSMLVKNAQGATVYSTLDSANALTDAKKIAGEYDIETMLIPGTTDKKIVFTNRQTGKQFTLTVTQAPDGSLTEATHRLGCKAATIDWRFDFTLDNYDAGVMKGLFALQCFNADTESAMYWCMRHRPAGETDYGLLEDYYLMKLDETDGLQVNVALSEGTSPTWVKVLTESDVTRFVQPSVLYGTTVGDVIIPGFECEGQRSTVSNHPTSYVSSGIKFIAPFSGVIRFRYKASGEAGAGGTTFYYTCVYVNGVAVGNEHTATGGGDFKAYYDDLTVVKDDVIELYWKSSNDACAVNVKNAALCRNGAGKHYTALI